MYKTKFSIQIHKQRKKHYDSHFDLRVMNRRRTQLLSWALPKSKFPEYGEKVLAIQTPNHRLSYMYFEGRLENGDIVELYDRGNCAVLLEKYNMMILKFLGSKIRGIYNFISIQSKTDQKTWLVMRSKREIGLN